MVTCPGFVLLVPERANGPSLSIEYPTLFDKIREVFIMVKMITIIVDI
jgi:hypothetical protein